jgi:histidinol-phosphatase (PHP family)
MLPDYHLHTSLCKHADGTPAEYRAAARKKRIPEICFTDHCPNPDGYDPENRMALSRFMEYRRNVIALQDDASPGVLFGIEADYYTGCEKFLREWLPSQGFDFVLGSVHFIRDWGFDNPEDRHVWDEVNVTDAWKSYFNLIGRLADTRLFDAVGHLDLPKKFKYRPREKDLAEMAKPTLDRIARSGMGIEINTSGLRKPVGEIYPSLLLLSLAHELDIPICFGSDAHRPSEVGGNLDAARALATEAGYSQYFRIKARKKTLQEL